MTRLWCIVIAAAIAVVPCGATGATSPVDGREFTAIREAGPGAYDASLYFAKAEVTAADWRALVAHGPQGWYELTVGAGGVELAKRAGEGRTALAQSKAAVKPADLRTLVVRRLDDEVVVLVNGSAVCRAMDVSLGAGAVLVETGAGRPVVERAVLRRREPIFFTDDFMVTEKEATADRGWRAVAGAWECKSLRPEDVASNEQYYLRSANPFVYQGRPSGAVPALALHGEEWWSGYSYRASVKCLEGGAAGIAFGCESGERFWLVRLECAGRFAQPARLQLVRVEPGKRTVVAECGVRTRHGHWYGLSAEVYDGRVRVGFSGSDVLDVADARISGGPIGLYAEGSGGAVFDDVEVRDLGRFRFDRADDLALGQAAAGSWRAREAGRGTTEFVGRGDDCMMLFGSPAWRGGAVTAEVQPVEAGMAGVVAGADGGDMLLLALKPRGEGTLILRRGGADKTLADFGYEDGTGEWCRVGLTVAEEGVVSAYVGGGLVARARAPVKPVGRVGLFSSGASGTAFRNLMANRSPQLLAPHQIGNAIFLGDAYMSSWATERGQWVPDDGLDRALSMAGSTFDGKNVFWRKGDYYGDFVLVLPLTIQTVPTAPAGVAPAPPTHQPIAGSLAMHFCLGPGNLSSGYSVSAKCRAPGRYDVQFAWRDKVLAAVSDLPVTDDVHEVTIYKSGRFVWAKFGPSELFTHRTTERATGTRIAAVRDGAVDFDRLAVYAESLDDSSFDRAPVNWNLIGNWQITNRFRCDPRWSWMGIDSLTGHAAVWHRRQFPGDLTLDVYASMKMRPATPYYCPSDLNLTISADRESVGSGYTFIVGGWRNARTALLRNGREVAATTDEYLPDTRDAYPGSEFLHRRWFYARARRTGGRLELFLDNKRYLDYTDPEPLRGGHVAVWTQEQSIMVARAMVFYSRTTLPSPLVEPTAVEPTTPRAEPLAVTCGPRSGWFFDFESGTRDWAEGRGAGLAMATVDTEAAPHGGGHAGLRLVNAECPGRFIAHIPVGQVNVLACPLVSFDYRIPPGVKVNLYFDLAPGGRAAATRTCFIALTGPEDSTGGVRCIGRFADAQSDDRWRHAEANLAGLMRQFHPAASALWASNFRLGLDHRQTYAVSGLGGNEVGAEYHLDNFLLVSAAAGDLNARWTQPAGKVSGYAWSVDGDCDSDPGSRASATEPAASVKSDATGLRFFHVKPVGAAGGPECAVAHVPFWDAGAKIEAASVSPPPRSKWGGEPIRLQLRKEQVAALDTESVQVTFGSARSRLDGKAVSMDWPNGVLTIDPSRLPATFADGAVVSGLVTLRAFGQTEASEVSVEYVASAAADRTPPGPVVVEGGPDEDDFESDADDWVGEAHTLLGIDRHTAARGTGSLCLYNASDGSVFTAYRSLRRVGRVGAFPVIEFDYKVSEPTRPDLMIRSGSGSHGFKFLDRSPGARVGEVPNVVSDGQWHRATVDVFEPFWQNARLALCAPLIGVGFGDLGWPSAREGDFFHIDNFRLVPVVSTRPGLELRWKANDAFGVAGCSARWSAAADEEAPKTINVQGDTATFRDIPEGRQYLHIRAADRAGNWGPTTHAAFLIDNTPPEVAQINPRPGGKSSLMRFSLGVKDAYGPDPGSLRLTVDGKAYTFYSESLSNAHRPAIAWDQSLTPEDVTPVPNGKAVDYVLSGVKDFAGNAIEPMKGTWTMDYAQDRDPPPRPELEPTSAEVAFVQRFDQGLDGALPVGYATVTHFLAREAGSHVLSYMTTSAGQQSVTLAHREIDLAKTGLIALDVRLPKGSATYLDLLITGNGFNAKVRMGDQPPTPSKPGTVEADGYTFLGDMQNIRAADAWTTQWADLYELVKTQFPNLKSYTVTRLFIGRVGAPFTHTGHAVLLDNVMVFGPGKADAAVKLRSRDITGLTGYAVAVSRDYAGAPVKQVNQRGDVWTGKAGAGVSFIKVLACDGNGNWSQLPGVLPYVVK